MIEEKNLKKKKNFILTVDYEENSECSLSIKRRKGISERNKEPVWMEFLRKMLMLYKAYWFWLVGN